MIRRTHFSIMIDGVRQISALVESVQLWITGVSLMIMVAIVAIDVFLRSVLNYPLMWAQEVAMWAFIWATFMGELRQFDRNLISKWISYLQN